MPLDAICLAGVREELRGRIRGMKVDKIQQPERDMVILSLRGAGAPPCRLLISAGTGDARVHLTGYRFDNPGSPPMFCMLLRKHLIGARIADIEQPPAERVLGLILEAPDAMGVVTEKRLTVELIGRMSNIILTDRDGIIIDCLRRVGGELSDKRDVLPGLFYRPPKAQQGKIDPLCVTADRWREMFLRADEKTADGWLLSNFTALSPLICRELSWRAYGEADAHIGRIGDGGEALSREFFELTGNAKAGRFEPWVLMDADSALRDFSYTRIMQYENAMDSRRFEDFSAMLDEYYTRAAQQTRVRQRASATLRAVKTARDRLIRKLAAQQAELEKTADRNKYRECGDIITSNMHLMKKGQHVLTAQDFYSGGGASRDIALDPLKTPQQNAAKYYKDYTKAKNAERYLTEQIALGSSELEYLDSVLHELELADGARDLGEIRSELMQTGYVKAQKQAKEKPLPSEPMRFVSSGGMQILAGRNNTQNDKLTLKTASKSDIWLHAQKVHGAHVVISCGGATPDEASLHEAASIAAWFSSARGGGRIPVDYALVKHVKKPPGGRPGMVVYSDHRTIAATPDEALVARLRSLPGNC